MTTEAFSPDIVPASLAIALVTSLAALTIDIRIAPDSGARSGRARADLAAGGSRRTGELVASIFTVVSLLAVGASLVLAQFSEAPSNVGTRVVGVALALCVATIGGGPFSLLALRMATRGQSRPGEHGGILVGGSPPPVPNRRGLFARRNQRPTEAEQPRSIPAPAEAEAVEVLRGGTTIGLLERIAIAGAILAGFPEAIAIVIAIKGVGRFSELAASEAKERFIIGTLASFVWACACALVIP
jgi:hypothetical protein